MYLLATLTTLIIQLTDFKLFDLKLGDIYSLLLIPYFFILPPRNKQEKLFKQLLLSFSLTLITSYLVLLWIDLYPTSSPSLLKKEGIISLSRYVQYAGCVFFAWTIHARLKGMPLRKRLRFFSIIDTQMFWCGLILSTFWLLTYAGIQTGFTYLDEHRLNGGYVEGGPFGLFYAFFSFFE